MRNRMRTLSVVWLLAGATVLIAAGTMPFHPRQAVQTAVGQTSKTGRFTKTEIMALSEPIVQTLLMHTTRIETVATPIDTFVGTGEVVHHWSIDCTDVKTGNMAHLLWNADTGELLRVSQSYIQEGPSSFNALSSQKEAVGLAWDWFHAMKINRPSEEWRFVGAHKKPYSQWDICLRSGERYSIVTVKTDSGQLVQALCGSLPNATTAWAPFKMDAAS